MTVTLPTPELAGDHIRFDAQPPSVSGTPTSTTGAIRSSLTQDLHAAVVDTQPAGGQVRDDAHTPTASGTPTSDATAIDRASIQRHTAAVSEPNLTDDQRDYDNHHDVVVGDPACPDAIPCAAPTPGSRPGTPSSPAATPQGDPNFTGSHVPGDFQCESAAGEPTSTRTGQRRRDTQVTVAHPGGFLRDPVIGVLADVVDDFEKVRIANTNRVRILTRTEADSDGEERGFGLTEDHPEVKKLILTVKAMEQAEHDAILNLQRALRKHPLAPFQKSQKGVGEKQFARLLAVIGDPYWNDLHDRPRTVSELWAYCGFDVRNGVAPKRMRGQQSNWSEDARKRVWVIASAMPKFAGGHYEQVYRAAREKYADATHSTECVRCGPSGKPAQPDTDLSDGHKHARAVRIVAKELLKDIWRESRDLYRPEEN